MFETICFRRMRGLGDPQVLDVGVLAEALLFYGRVHLVAEASMLRQLITDCGPETINVLIDEGFLTVHFLEDPAGIGTYDAPSPERAAHLVVSHLHYNLHDEAEQGFRDATQSLVRGRDLARRFTAHVHPIGYDENFVARFDRDLDDVNYTRGAVVSLLQLLAPGYSIPDDLRFDVSRDVSTHDLSQFRIVSNIDFVAANSFYEAPPGAEHLRRLDISLLLLHLLEARADLEFASHFNAEIASSPSEASVIQLRLQDDLVAASQHHLDEIQVFENMVLPQGHMIREAINSGERTYRDVISLLQHAQKFRSWLAGQAPSAQLVQEYYREVTAKTWVEELPGKPFRWLVVNALSTLAGTLAGNPVAGVAIGLIISGIDTFVLDNILRGWRPNQFVEGKLSDFVRSV